MNRKIFPYIHLKIEGGAVKCAGNISAQLGHKIITGSVVDGIYATWEWDGENLFVSNDRYGLYTIFIYQSECEIIVSPNLALIIDLLGNNNIHFDDDAMAVFLRFGTFIADDTPFKEIRSMPPGVKSCIGFGCFTSNNTIFSSHNYSLNKKQAMEGFIDLFKTSISKRISTEPFSLPLSGGQDSRHILLELNSQNSLPDFCCTAKYYPPSLSNESDIAKTICTMLNLKHAVVGQRGSRFQNESNKNVLTNFCSSSMHSWFKPVADLINSSSALTLYDGIAGDILSANPFSNETIISLYERRKCEKIAEYLFDNELYLKNSLSSEYYDRWSRERALAHMTKELRKHENKINPTNNFFFWSRTRKFAHQGMIGMVDSRLKVFAPFLDHDLFDFMMSQNSRMFIDKHFHAESLAMAYPKFAKIPFSHKKDGIALPFYFQRFAFETLRSDADVPCSVVNKSFYKKRLLRCLIDFKYMPSVNWLAPNLIYLNQLSRIVNS